MKKIMVFLLFISFVNCLFAQTVNDRDIRKFLEQKGELEQDAETSIYAFELLSNKPLMASDNCGIYRIGTFADHSFTYLLLLENGKKKFIDCQSNLLEILNILIPFLENSNCHMTNKDNFLYLKKVVDVYKKNMDVIPW